MSQVFYHQEHLKYALPPRVKPKKWRSLTVLNNISPGPIHFVATLLGEDQPNQATSQSALPFYQAAMKCALRYNCYKIDRVVLTMIDH